MLGEQQGDDRVWFILGRLGGKAQKKIRGRVVDVASTVRVSIRMLSH